MKKQFLLLATFALVAASCSKNTLVTEPDVAYDASVINFAPSTGLSKANNNNGESLEGDTGGFEVFGLKSDASMLFVEPETAGDNHYKYTGGTPKWVWGLASDKKWPTDANFYPLTFLAMYPKVEFKDNYTTLTGWTKEFIQGITTALTIDQLSALTKDVASAPVSGALSSLQFKHIMSQIKFSVSIPKGFTVYVNKVIYHNLHNVNTYDYSTQKWATVATASAGTTHYEYATNTMQDFVGEGKLIPIATTDGHSIKAVPQNFATAWQLADFKAVSAAWKDKHETAASSEDEANADWPSFEGLADALASGTYVELQYALVDANGVSQVGLITGTQRINAAGKTEAYTGENQFLKVAYLVDLTKVITPEVPEEKDADGKVTTEFVPAVTTALLPAKSYTYEIKLGTTDATGGTVLDPTFTKADGTPGEDNDKEPGDNVNDKEENIGFSVSVEEWTDGSASFEPIPNLVP